MEISCRSGALTGVTKLKQLLPQHCFKLAKSLHKTKICRCQCWYWKLLLWKTARTATGPLQPGNKNSSMDTDCGLGPIGITIGWETPGPELCSWLAFRWPWAWLLCPLVISSPHGVHWWKLQTHVTAFQHVSQKGHYDIFIPFQPHDSQVKKKTIGLLSGLQRLMEDSAGSNLSAEFIQWKQTLEFSKYLLNDCSQSFVFLRNTEYF